LFQALQYFGQVVPFSTLPAALATFHSAPHFFYRSRMAAVAGLVFAVSFFAGTAVDAGVAVCAATPWLSDPVINAAANAGDKIVLFIFSPIFTAAA
jgi:hypothetical protein